MTDSTLQYRHPKSIVDWKKSGWVGGGEGGEGSQRASSVNLELCARQVLQLDPLSPLDTEAYKILTLFDWYIFHLFEYAEDLFGLLASHKHLPMREMKTADESEVLSSTCSKTWSYETADSGLWDFVNARQILCRRNLHLCSKLLGHAERSFSFFLCLFMLCNGRVLRAGGEMNFFTFAVFIATDFYWKCRMRFFFNFDFNVKRARLNHRPVYVQKCVSHIFTRVVHDEIYLINVFHFQDANSRDIISMWPVVHRWQCRNRFWTRWHWSKGPRMGGGHFVLNCRCLVIVRSATWRMTEEL